MKLFVAVALGCFLWVGAAHAQTLTSRQWMIQDSNSRAAYVLGYMNGIQQMLDHFSMEIRSDSEKPLTSGMVSEDLFRKLLAEPELRNGPVNDILFAVFAPRVVVTDKAGKQIPAWEKLLTTSQCAGILGKYQASATR
jgi:hypothetical protein